MAELRKDISDIEVPADTLANILDLSRPRVVQLANEGTLRRNPNKKYSLEWNLMRYVRFLRSKPDDEDNDEKNASSMYWQEKALHEKAKRETTEIRLEKLKNKMHDSYDVEIVMSEMLTNLRTQLLGIASVLAPQLAGKSKEEIDLIINSAIEEKLDELKDYSPELFAGESDDESDDDDPENS